MPGRIEGNVPVVLVVLPGGGLHHEGGGVLCNLRTLRAPLSARTLVASIFAAIPFVSLILQSDCGEEQG